MELVLADPPVDLASMLDSQRELFHRQIEQLQRAVVTQCRLTGVNPLSQEMAAEALSINIGKRPRDLLNPKAIKYMQSVFSVKDSVGKKESREISAMYGITLTQVRDYFAGQRSRVRKSIRLSREKAQKFNETKPSEVTLGVPDEVLGESEHASVSSTDSEQLARAQMDVDNHTSGALNNSNYLGSTDNRINGECNMNLSHEEITPDINMEDKKFLDNIFTLMRREQTFSGQAKLMEWVLQINNSAILYWFLTKGGASILASWLSQSSLEEQTSMILVIFKVLCHLPLQKAPPLQLSSILQTVNKLRFYRTSDISNKARFLLSRWSKLLVRNRVAKNSLKSDGAHNESPEEQRAIEMLSDGTWQLEVDLPEDVRALARECPESIRLLESKQVLRILPASCDNSSRKRGRIALAAKTKERRKVLLVEHPEHVNGRSTPASRAVAANVSRPLSADDIQKAKLRASFMQSKLGETDGATLNKVVPKLKEKTMSPACKAKTSTADASVAQPSTGTLSDLKQGAVTFENAQLKDMTSHQIPWRKPPEMIASTLWRLSFGENSKEMEIQIARNRREQEVLYQITDEIPQNPKEPWDMEMDFDDSLTPEIPTEQPSDEDEEAAATTAMDCPCSVDIPTDSVTEAAVLPVLQNSDVVNASDPCCIPTLPFPPDMHESTSNSMPFPLQTAHVMVGGSAHIPPRQEHVVLLDSSIGSHLHVFPETESAIVASSITFPLPPPPCDTPAMETRAPLPFPVEVPSQTSNEPPVPDLELLAVLLNNPSLVFALTSGQANGISEEQMVAVLDLLKKGGAELSAMLNPSSANLVARHEVTRLPSPTPPEADSVRSSVKFNTMRLPSPTPPEAEQSEWQQQDHQKALPHSMVPLHRSVSSRDTSMNYATDNRQQPYLMPAAVIPRALRDPIPNSSASRTFASFPSTTLPSPSYNAPTQTLGNRFLHNEPAFAPQDIVHIPESSNPRYEPVSNRMRFGSTDVTVTSSPPCVPLNSLAKGTFLQETSDLRLTNHGNPRLFSSHPFRTNQPSIERDSFPGEAPSTMARSRQQPPADDRVFAAAPRAVERYPSPSGDSMADFEEVEFSIRSRRYDYDHATSTPSRSPPTYATPSSRRSFDSWSQDRQDGKASAPHRNHRYIDDDRDNFRAQTGRRVSGWDVVDVRGGRDWDKERNRDHSRHSPAKRRWRDRDRRR